MSSSRRPPKVRAPVSAGDGAEQSLLIPDAVPTASLRQQMDRQCKQRRFLDAADEPFPDPVEAEVRLALGAQLPALGARPPTLGAQPPTLGAHVPGYPPGVEVKREPHGDAGGGYWARQGHSVVGPEHCVPGRSVFDVDAYPESGEPPLSPLLVVSGFSD